MKYIDLTRLIIDKMPVYPGDTEVQIKNTMNIKESGIANQSLTCSMHTGTHIDSPSHMILNGKKLTDFDISVFIGPAKLIDARGYKQIDIELFEKIEIKRNDIVLIFTDYDKKFFESDFYNSYPAITEKAAKYLVSCNIKMIGLDTPSPDYFPFNIHKILMSCDILIIENLINLNLLKNLKNFEIIALPLKTETDGALARVIALSK